MVDHGGPDNSMARNKHPLRRLPTAALGVEEWRNGTYINPMHVLRLGMWPALDARTKQHVSHVIRAQHLPNVARRCVLLPIYPSRSIIHISDLRAATTVSRKGGGGNTYQRVSDSYICPPHWHARIRRLFQKKRNANGLRRWWHPMPVRRPSPAPACHALQKNSLQQTGAGLMLAKK